MGRVKPIRVKTVLPLDGFRVKIGFTDETERIVDLERFLWGPVFEPIRKNRERFLQVYIDPETRTVTWPNGADLCPDVLYYDGPPPWSKKHLKEATP